MINEKAFLKLPIEVPGLCKVYPPSINDVASETYFPLYREFLTRSVEDLEDLYEKKHIEGEAPTPLQTILGFSMLGAENMKVMQNAFSFFIKEPVTFLLETQCILIGEPEVELKKGAVEKLRLLKEDNFNNFQNAIRLAVGEDPYEPFIIPEGEDPRKTRMRRLARQRDRVAKKGKKNGEGLNFSASLAAICCMNLGLSPLTVGEISYAAMGTLIRYYQEKRKYETDIETLLAGGDSKKIKPKDWIRNIE